MGSYFIFFSKWLFKKNMMIYYFCRRCQTLICSVPLHRKEVTLCMCVCVCVGVKNIKIIRSPGAQSIHPHILYPSFPPRNYIIPSCKHERPIFKAQTARKNKKIITLFFNFHSSFLFASSQDTSSRGV